MKRGRKIKLTDEIIERFCDCIRNGLSNKDACIACRICEETFYSWKRDVEENNQEKPNFTKKVKLLECIKEAEADFKNFHIKNINELAQKDWKASAWMLERRFPQEYARIDRNAASSTTQERDVEDLTPIADMLKETNEDYND